MGCKHKPYDLRASDDEKVCKYCKKRITKVPSARRKISFVGFIFIILFRVFLPSNLTYGIWDLSGFIKAIVMVVFLNIMIALYYFMEYNAEYREVVEASPYSNDDEKFRLKD